MTSVLQSPSGQDDLHPQLRRRTPASSGHQPLGEAHAGVWVAGRDALVLGEREHRPVGDLPLQQVPPALPSLVRVALGRAGARRPAARAAGLGHRARGLRHADRAAAGGRDPRRHPGLVPGVVAELERDRQARAAGSPSSRSSTASSRTPRGRELEEHARRGGSPRAGERVEEALEEGVAALRRGKDPHVGQPPMRLEPRSGSPAGSRRPSARTAASDCTPVEGRVDLAGAQHAA